MTNTEVDAPSAMVDLMHRGPVIPVVVTDDATTAVPLARALARGGVEVVEITLRTGAALDVIRRISDEVPDVVVGAGTVTSPRQAAEAERAGARFLVTPGGPAGLVEAAIATGLPVLPGATSLTEMMTLLERGLRALKFFPAVPAGGVDYLRAVHGPLPQALFCPTGGITPRTAGDFLALPNVACVGGSWLTPPQVLAAQDWDQVTALASGAASLREDRHDG